MSLITAFLRGLVRRGRLTLIDAYGKRHEFSGAALDGVAPVTIRLTDPSLHWRIPLNPSLVIGEAYMDGTLKIEEGSLHDFLAIGMDNLDLSKGLVAMGERWSIFLRRLQQYNPMGASRRNVAHHYDLSDKLYSLFLDGDRQYSCAYFPANDISLDRAQIAKKRHLMSKLMLEPGQRVLDIGCGWGGLALTMAREHDVEVTGITLSQEQLKVAQQRAEEAQLSHKVHFLLKDYREIKDRFDRIVSVGMFEHVGINHYPGFFRRMRGLLSDKGVALLHSIGRGDGPGATNKWVRKYIFPGGYCPALSEVLPAIERSGLRVTDIEILRDHYAKTLRHWYNRFTERRAQAAAIYDERFCRMWEFYLVGSEVSFRHGSLMNFQVQMAYPDAPVPLTRDYMHTYEQSYPRS